MSKQRPDFRNMFEGRKAPQTPKKNINSKERIIAMIMELDPKTVYQKGYTSTEKDGLIVFSNYMSVKINGSDPSKVISATWIEAMLYKETQERLTALYAAL